MCPECWEDLPGVDDLRLCPACLREAYDLQFWDIIGSDGDLVDMDEWL